MGTVFCGATFERKNASMIFTFTDPITVQGRALELLLFTQIYTVKITK